MQKDDKFFCRVCEFHHPAAQVREYGVGAAICLDDVG